MFITWQGIACFKIQTQTATVILDPYDNTSGLRSPRLSGDLVLVSKNNPLFNNSDAVKGVGDSKPLVITSAGEYEAKNIYVYGVRSVGGGKEKDESIVYRMEIEDVAVATLGGICHNLANGDLELFEKIDVLLVPVGGNITLGAKEAAQIINQIEPRIVIPMLYKTPGVKLKLATLDPFCKELGVCPKEIYPKIKITKKDLPAEQMQIVVLQP